jgi:putative transposase
MGRPKDWIEFVKGSESESELDDVGSSAQRGRPFGSEDGVIKIAKQLGVESTMNSRGRPKRT